MTNVNLKFKKSEVNYKLIESMIKGIVENSNSDEIELNISFTEMINAISDCKKIYKQGDIIELDFGENNYGEISGIKKAIIIQNDTGNKFSPTLIVIPIETDVNEKLPYDILSPYGVIRPTKITTIDKERVLRVICSEKSSIPLIKEKVLDNLHEKIISSSNYEKIDKFRRGNVVLANLSDSIGSEQGGVRPVLILQNTNANIKYDTLIVAPLSIKKATLPTHKEVETECNVEEGSVILFEQIKTINKARVIKVNDYIDIDKSDYRDKIKIAIS